MAMNATTLGETIGQTLFDAIPSSIKSCMSSAQCAETLSNLQDAWKGIASDIVNHITGNAEVKVAAGIHVTAGSCTGATDAVGSGTIS